MNDDIVILADFNAVNAHDRIGVALEHVLAIRKPQVGEWVFLMDADGNGCTGVVEAVRARSAIVRLDWHGWVPKEPFRVQHAYQSVGVTARDGSSTQGNVAILAQDVEGSVTGIDVTMLLCDAAVTAPDGKLYILGGGWSVVRSGTPFNMALAVRIAIPWDQTNEPHSVEGVLLTEDGNPVDLGAGPVGETGELEVGRPPGLPHGVAINSAFVMNFAGVALMPGGYVWELRVNGAVKARAPFLVLSSPGG